LLLQTTLACFPAPMDVNYDPGKLYVITYTMRHIKLEYGRVDEVSYRVDPALGQGEFPRDPSLSHVKWMKWLGSTLNGHRARDIQGVVVSHSWVPL
jgi:hypothetical protein